MTDNEVKMWCKLQGTRYWSANNGASHYTLTRKGALTRAIVSAIEKAPLTKKEFFKEQGITSDQGYLSQFFAAMRQSGVAMLDTKTWKYSLGSNYYHWKVGMLERI